MTREQFIARVNATQKGFRRFLVALCCGDTAMADDVAQEAYIKAYLSCRRLSDPQNFRAWLNKIGHTTFIDHLRGAKPTVGYDAADAIADERRADDSFRYQALYAALNRLSPRERSALLLFYIEGYSVKEISAIIEASTDAVKQYLSRGRKNLRTLLNNER